jgi:leucine dehydrogenase
MVEAFINSSRRSKRSVHPHVQYTVCDSLMRYAKLLGFGDLHIKIDEKTGLMAIVAIHNLKRGPAIGGCRMLNYKTVDKAVEDALRLARMMSFKAAINNLAHGGGKAVLIRPAIIKDREAYFEKFGEFLNELGGRYITAVDSGTSPREMDIIARKTPFVTCTTNSGADSDPSPLTALGVRRGIESAVKFKMGRDSLEGVRIAIQGAGHVGYWLAKDLKERGAHITIADVKADALQTISNEIKVDICHPDEIYDLDIDVFSPCALGAVLNKDTIKRLKAGIVAGSANNQLAHHHYGTFMHERGILYAPDFLINAGGIIHVAVTYDRGDIKQSLQQINNIYDTVYEIFARSEQEDCATNDIAEKIACDRLR